MTLKLFRKQGQNSAAATKGGRLPCRLIAMALILVATAWHLVSQKPYDSIQSEVLTVDDAEPWWHYYVEKSKAQGPLEITRMPFQVPGANELAILAVLKHYNVDPKNSSQKLTIIDIGRPTESVDFAKSGYYTESFEARAKGVEEVQKFVSNESDDVQHRIHLHHTALSNVSNTTLEIFDANDSSSLLESAIGGKQEKRKFARTGGRKETVPVNVMDSYLQPDHRVVAMKIDTQGVEPEIFMGSNNLFHQQSSFMVIATEYCARMRDYDALILGPHLLNGLGFKCYLKRAQKLVLDAKSDFCGDFLCIHEERAKKGIVPTL